MDIKGFCLDTCDLHEDLVSEELEQWKWRFAAVFEAYKWCSAASIWLLRHIFQCSVAVSLSKVSLNSGKHSLKAAISLAENLPCPYVALAARNDRKGKNRTVMAIYLPHPFLSYLDASKESKAEKRSNGLPYINH